MGSLLKYIYKLKPEDDLFAQGFYAARDRLFQFEDSGRRRSNRSQFLKLQEKEILKEDLGT